MKNSERPEDEAIKATAVARQYLPEFENPPVVEVVCGIQFKTLNSLLIPYLGVLWQRIKEDYPECSEVAPLIPAIERFEKTGETSAFELSGELPLPRVWFLHKDGNGVLQIQRDRLLHNWRKAKPTDAYPRYSHVIELFRMHLQTFQSFLEGAKLGTLSPVQYEMTYINHIPQGDGWQSISDIGTIFPDFCWRASEERFLSKPGQLSWKTSFALPDRVGRLHVTIQSGVRNDDNCPILMLDLTARGIARDGPYQGIWQWFDLAHEWIVRGFADLTGPLPHREVWRRTR